VSSLHQEREEDLENLLNRGALWAVTYGDLMSYLMIFFLLLFVFSLSGGKGFEEGLSNIQESFGGEVNVERLARAQRRDQEQVLAADVQRRFQEQGLEQFAHVEVFENKVRITLREPVLFDSGKAFLKPEALPVMKQVALFLRQLPNPIVIEGHTDDVPVGVKSAFETNWQLSMARAYTVIRYMVDVETIAPKRLSGVGYGEYRPAVPNDSTVNRALNRRIEINLLREGV
jgi:chemotaxis protein MotB